MSGKRDYYEVLGVEKSSDANTIKRAYRKLAMKYHPDRNENDAEAEEMFKEVSEAYAVLSDDDKRARYDQFGHAGLNGQNMGFNSAEDIFRNFGDIFGSDIFGDLFGFGGGGGGGRSGPRKGESLGYRLEVDFLEAALGCEKEISVPRQVHCGDCNGTGAAKGSKPVTCDMCNGMGVVLQQQMFLRIKTTCPKCKGSGKVIVNPCQTCRGSGRVKESKDVTIPVPAGADNGTRLKISGMGNDGEASARPGDLIVELRVKQHELFVRDGNDVIIEAPISYPQACLGAQIKVPTIDGEETLDVPAGTQSGKVFTLRGRGIRHIRSERIRGDQHIQVYVAVPERMSAEETELIKNLAELQGESVGKKGLFGFFR